MSESLFIPVEARPQVSEELQVEAWEIGFALEALRTARQTPSAGEDATAPLTSQR
jgi:hypothetical protein